MLSKRDMFNFFWTRLTSHHHHRWSHEIAHFCGTKGTIYWWTKVEIGFGPVLTSTHPGQSKLLSLCSLRLLFKGTTSSLSSSSNSNKGGGGGGDHEWGQEEEEKGCFSLCQRGGQWLKVRGRYISILSFGLFHGRAMYILYIIWYKKHYFYNIYKWTIEHIQRLWIRATFSDKN